MGKLRLVPVPCPCDDDKMNLLRVPLGMTHEKSVRCPFLSSEFQHEVREGTCCSWDLDELEAALEAVQKLPELDCEWLDAIHIREHRTAEEGWSLAENLTNLRKDLSGLIDADAAESGNRTERAKLAWHDAIAASADWLDAIGAKGFGTVAAHTQDTIPKSANSF